MAANITVQKDNVTIILRKNVFLKQLLHQVTEIDCQKNRVHLEEVGANVKQDHGDTDNVMTAQNGGIDITGHGLSGGSGLIDGLFLLVGLKVEEEVCVPEYMEEHAEENVHSVIH